MNASSPPPATALAARPRRRLWPWILGLCLAPFLVLGIAAANCLTLDRDAAALRRQVMRATDADWHTKIQFSVGGLTLGGLRAVLGFFDRSHVQDARLALGAVGHASVGVYERDSGGRDWSVDKLLGETDRAMQRRGWSRLVGVAGGKETVLIYVAEEIRADRPVDLCLAVIEGRRLVVVSTSLEAEALTELIGRHHPGGLRGGLRGHAALAAR